MAIARFDARSQAGNLLASMTILGAYVFTFFPLYRVNGPGTAALATVPVIAFAWLWGFRVGLAAGLLSLPLNTLLFNLVGLEGWEAVFRQGGGPGQVMAILIGAGIGRLRDLSEQLKEEITKRKRTEEKLKRLAAILEGTSDFVATADLEGNIRYINSAGRKMMGIGDEEDISNLRITDCHSEPALALMMAEAVPGATSDGVWSGESTLHHRDGREIPVSQVIVAHKSPTGTVEFLSCIERDITEQKRAEDVLRDSEEKYRDLVENIPEVVYRWEVRDNPRTVYLSRRMEDLTGYPVENFLSDWNFWGQLIHPEDRERVYQEVEEAIRTASGFRSEYRLRHKGGGERFVMDIAKPFKDRNGAVRWWDGIVIDITDRKRAEESLRFTQFAVDHASDAAFWIKPDGSFFYVNDAACRALGYTREELLSMTVSDIDPDYPQETWAEHWENMKQRVSYTFEAHHRSKDGSVFPVEITTNHLEFGGQEYNCAFARNITERKRAEEALRLIVEGTASVTGADFFRSLVRHLASALQVRYAFVAECADLTVTRVRTLAFWTGEDLGENFEYSLAGTPCEKVVGGEMCYHPEGVQALFPEDKDLVEIGAESYLGVPLFDSSGKALGHLAVLDDKPMSAELRFERKSILGIFAARAGAELERERAEEALRLLSGRLLKLQDEERRRIARELHDTTAQGLAALVANIGAARRSVPKLNQKAHHALSESIALAKESLKEIRTLSYLLHPPELDEFGLVSAIRQYVVGFEKRTRIHVDTDLQPEIDQVRPEAAIALFRIVQESLANIHHHSRSRRAKIKASCDSNRITLQIQDTGRGLAFKGPRSAKKGILSLGVGIASMKERLLQLGGELEIDSSRRGTTLTATIPSSKAN